MTNIQAKVWYLTSAKNFQLYGATFFSVIYKGFWSYPNNLILALDHAGFKFVHFRTKAIMAEFPYSRLESVAVDVLEQAVTLNMKTTLPEEQRYYTFQTQQKEDIAAQIASYSPPHSNFLRVGDLKLRRVMLNDGWRVSSYWEMLSQGRVTEEERFKAWEEVRYCRKALADHNLLRRPADSSGGFLTTTLRRQDKHQLLLFCYMAVALSGTTRPNWRDCRGKKKGRILRRCSSRTTGHTQRAAFLNHFQWSSEMSWRISLAECTHLSRSMPGLQAQGGSKWTMIRSTLAWFRWSFQNVWRRKSFAMSSTYSWSNKQQTNQVSNISCTNTVSIYSCLCLHISTRSQQQDQHPELALLGFDLWCCGTTKQGW